MKLRLRAWVRFLQEMHIVKELRCCGSVITDGYDYAIESDAVDVIQYIGLKDINGVSIFQGDVVKAHGYVGNLTVEYKTTDGCCALASFCLCDTSGDIAFFDFDRVEVIGNKYQNPELLE
jgi:uncharacterized phage protein (TIGR01671 family)